jgi:hypothetical protein
MNKDILSEQNEQLIRDRVNFVISQRTKGVPIDEILMSNNSNLTSSRQDSSSDTCDEIEAAFHLAALEIKNSSHDNMKMFLEQHDKMIESRTDFSNCQKAVRRKRVITMWQASKD